MKTDRNDSARGSSSASQSAEPTSPQSPERNHNAPHFYQPFANPDALVLTPEERIAELEECLPLVPLHEANIRFLIDAYSSGSLKPPALGHQYFIFNGKVYLEPPSRDDAPQGSAVWKEECIMQITGAAPGHATPVMQLGQSYAIRNTTPGNRGMHELHAEYQLNQYYLRQPRDQPTRIVRLTSGHDTGSNCPSILKSDLDLLEYDPASFSGRYVSSVFGISGRRRV